jgi:hypothetical protein
MTRSSKLPGEAATAYHMRLGYPWAVLDILEEDKYFRPLLEIEPRSFRCQAFSVSHHTAYAILTYSGSIPKNVLSIKM